MSVFILSTRPASCERHSETRTCWSITRGNLRPECPLNRVGLLYPGTKATLISDYLQRPEQLVILDGTWHHARRSCEIFRNCRACLDTGSLPLPPAVTAFVVNRLRWLFDCRSHRRGVECAGTGNSRLGSAHAGFRIHDRSSIGESKAEHGRRSIERRRRTFRNVPLALVDDLNHVVAVYGESAPGTPANDHDPRLPVYWVAQRVGTGERFACTVQPKLPLHEGFLGHFELSREDFPKRYLSNQRKSGQPFCVPAIV